MDFKISKRGSDFILYTGVPVVTLQKYEKEYTELLKYNKDGDNYIIPRTKLCDVLDSCFDHITEDTLLQITKLLDKNDSDMRDKITERSVSKRQHPREREKEQREKEQREREQREKEQRDREQREREQREKEQREREQREKEQRERDQREKEREKREKEKRVKELRDLERDRSVSDERDKRSTNQDLNYDEPVHKIELLRMVASIRNKLDSLEKYVNRM